MMSSRMWCCGKSSVQWPRAEEVWMISWLFRLPPCTARNHNIEYRRRVEHEMSSDKMSKTRVGQSTDHKDWDTRIWRSLICRRSFAAQKGNDEKRKAHMAPIWHTFCGACSEDEVFGNQNQWCPLLELNRRTCAHWKLTAPGACQKRAFCSQAGPTRRNLHQFWKVFFMRNLEPCAHEKCTV